MKPSPFMRHARRACQADDARIKAVDRLSGRQSTASWAWFTSATWVTADMIRVDRNCMGQLRWAACGER